MNNLSNVNFEKINAVAYTNEENIVKELLEYLKPEYYSKLNNIASLIDIDMNKIDKTDAHFIPKYKQIKTT